MPANCLSIRANGTPCNRPATLDNNTKCGIHNNSLILHGPHTFARRELGFINKKEINDAFAIYSANVAATQDAFLLEQLRLNYLADSGIMRARHRRALTDLVNQQREQIHLTGVDPDQPARERNRQRHAALIERRRQNMRNFANAHIVNVAPVVIPARALGAFVRDPQNVHTTEAVNQTKAIVAKILLIPVPDEYRWHAVNASKTPFEIGIDCKLSQKAAWQMISQYAQDTAIYDIETGIYGKVLDSIWQYIKNSSDKDDLCNIMRRELEDNIGMCAQGNLSRICNVLAGYMEGVGAQESISELLGRLLPPLMEIDDMYERIRQACMIMNENKVPIIEWDTWMSPLLEDESSNELYEIIKEELAV
jgi:hypothetical protein